MNPILSDFEFQNKNLILLKMWVQEQLVRLTPRMQDFIRFRISEQNLIENLKICRSILPVTPSSSCHSVCYSVISILFSSFCYCYSVIVVSLLLFCCYSVMLFCNKCSVIVFLLLLFWYCYSVMDISLLLSCYCHSVIVLLL